MRRSRSEQPKPLGQCGMQTSRILLMWTALGSVMVAGCTDSPATPPPAVSTAPTPAVPTPAVVPPIESVPDAAQSPDAAPPERAVEVAEAPAAPAAGGGQPAVDPPEQGPAKPRPILGKKTGDIRDAQKEEAKGAKRVQPRIAGKDPITITGNAYVSIVGRTEILRIRHTLDLYHAETGRYPKDYQEFMTEIIKKSGVRLSQLPYYQEYGYDPVQHELIILEYPDRKEGSSGR